MIIQPTREQTRRILRKRTYSGQGFGPLSFECLGMGMGIGLSQGASRGGSLAPLSSLFTGANLLQGCQSHLGLSYASVMLATGSGAPAAGISGTLTAGLIPKPVKVAITGNGTQTTATYSLYLDGGTTVVQSGTCAASVAIAGLPGLSVTFPVGAYTTLHSYQAVTSAWGDPAGTDANGYTFASTKQPIITPGFNGYPGLLLDGVDDVGINTTLTCPAVTSMRIIYRLVTFAAATPISGPNTNSASPFFYHSGVASVQAFATAGGSVALAGTTAVPVRARALFSNQATDTCRFGANVGTAVNAGSGRTGTGRQLGFSAAGGFVQFANMEIFGIWISSADQSSTDTAFDAAALAYYPTLAE